MASGDTLGIFTALNNEPPATGFATLDTRNSHAVLDFDIAGGEYANFTGVLPRNYAGSGITVLIHYAMTSATSSSVILTSAFERIGDGILDIDADSFAAQNTVTQAVPATTGHVDIASIAHTDGAQIDSLAVGESFRLQINRTADGTTGDLELLAVELKET